MALPESAAWDQWAAAAPFIHSLAASVGSCTCRVCRTGCIDGQPLCLFFLLSPSRAGQAGQASLSGSSPCLPGWPLFELGNWAWNVPPAPGSSALVLLTRCPRLNFLWLQCSCALRCCSPSLCHGCKIVLFTLGLFTLGLACNLRGRSYGTMHINSRNVLNFHKRIFISFPKIE